MSEKRHRQQQRRQRRKAQGAARSRTREDSPARVFNEAARLVVDSILRVTNAFEGEQLASNLFGMWRHHALPAEEAETAMLLGLVKALEAIGTAPALAALRALSAVGAPERAALARAAADRLAANGLPEAPWAADLGRARASAAMLVHDPVLDDGLTVMLEFDATYTIGVYIDHNLGGLVKDVVLAGPLAKVRDDLADNAPAEVVVRDITLAEARARVEAALDILDHTLQPPVTEDTRAFRALIEARLRSLPAGFELPDTQVEVNSEEREALVVDFLASPEGRRWQGDDLAEDVARFAIDFGADYNHGGPLRWSPVVVEMFLLDWLPRKVLHEPAFFGGVPAVLPSWVRYAGRRRGVPKERVREAVAAVDEFLADFQDALKNPPLDVAAVLAAVKAGLDPTDSEAVDRFMQQQNQGRAA